jgi:hypothetical protein
MSNKIFRSKNDFLFLTGGSNAASKLYTRSGFENSIDSNGWRHTIERRIRRCERANIRFCQLIIPEKLTVVSLDDQDRMSVFGSSDGILPPGERLLQSVLETQLIYPKDFLISQYIKYPIYSATDSHWTWIGAFSAFQILINYFGLEINYTSLLNFPRTIHRYHGDLWDPSLQNIELDSFERIELPHNIRRIYCNGMVGTKEMYNAENDTGLHVGSQCIFYNSLAQRQEIVILFGTSFSEYRLETSLLTALFAYFFNTVHFIWSTSLDFHYIERHRPDLVISELPERFLTSCPDDKLELEAFTAERISAWRSTRKTD